MNRITPLLGAVLLLGVLYFPGYLHAEPADVTDDTSEGWTPAQANNWMGVQMDYAKAVKQYGKDSPEATQAQVMMNTLARKLGIKASDAVPEIAPTSTLAAADEDESGEKKYDGPPLNAPAPENVSNNASDNPAVSAAPSEPTTPK